MKIEDINESNINSLLLHVSTDKDLFKKCTDTLILYLLYNYNTQHDVILSKIKILALGNKNIKNKKYNDISVDTSSFKEKGDEDSEGSREKECDSRDTERRKERRRMKRQRKTDKKRHNREYKEMNISFNSNSIINKIFKKILKIKSKEMEDSVIETSLYILEEKSLVLRETIFYYFENIDLNSEDVTEYAIEVLKRILNIYKIDFDTEDTKVLKDLNTSKFLSDNIGSNMNIDIKISKSLNNDVKISENSEIKKNSEKKNSEKKNSKAIISKINKISENSSDDGLIDITNMDFELKTEINTLKLNLNKHGDRDIYIEKLYKLLSVLFDSREYRGRILFLMFILLVNKVEEKKSLRDLIKVFFMGVTDLKKILKQSYSGVGKYGLFLLNRIIFECRKRKIEIKYKKMLKMVGILELRNKGVLLNVDWKDLSLRDLGKVICKFKKPGIFTDLCKKLIKNEFDIKKLQEFKNTINTVSEKKLTNYDFKRINLLKEFIDKRLEFCGEK